MGAVFRHLGSVIERWRDSIQFHVVHASPGIKGQHIHKCVKIEILDYQDEVQ